MVKDHHSKPIMVILIKATSRQYFLCVTFTYVDKQIEEITRRWSKVEQKWKAYDVDNS